MTERFFSWFPVTYERPARPDTRIVHAARYDDAEAEVVVEDGYEGRFVGVGTILTDSPDEFRFTSSDTDEVVILRQTREMDAAIARSQFPLGIPLPVDIIGALMTGSTTEPSVSAAIDDTGDVHTMILETGLGLYARYARSWIRMTDISPIEQLDIVDVPADDLEIYDQADDLGRSVTIREMHPVDQPAVGAVDVTPPTPVTAAAVAPQVIVASPADLEEAIAYAATDEGAGSRWYVQRRAKAFGWADKLPWEDQQ